MRASIVIPTLDGERYLPRILDAVAEQTEQNWELLVIDSGSRDATLDIVQTWGRARVHSLAPGEFQHGRTRQLAATMANGEFVVYLTQDAVPLGENWLAELLAPFALNPRVALVTGRQVPRSRAFPLQRFEIEGAFRALGPDEGISLFGAGATRLDDKGMDRAAFHSDVCAAVRRDIVMSIVPFREVRYAEDRFMGRDVLDAGLIKAYAARATVEHSNDLTLREYGARIVDETLGLRGIGAELPSVSPARVWLYAAKGVFMDSVRLVLYRPYGVRSFLWLLTNPAYHLMKWWSYSKAIRLLEGSADAAAFGLEAHRERRRRAASPRSHSRESSQN